MAGKAIRHSVVQPIEVDDRSIAVDNLRDRWAWEEHCMRVLGRLAWPNGKLKKGTPLERRAAQQELQRLANKVA